MTTTTTTTSTTSTHAAAAQPAGHFVRSDAQDWWVPIFRGGWLAIVGAFALLTPPLHLFALSLFFSTAALVAGGALLTDALWMRARSPLYLAQGVASIITGLVVAFLPYSLWRFSVGTVALWALLMAGTDAVVAGRHHALRGRRLLFASAIVTALAALAGVVGALLPRFLLDVQLFGALVALGGVLLIAYGFRRRRRHGHVAAAASAQQDDAHRLAHGTA